MAFLSRKLHWENVVASVTKSVEMLTLLEFGCWIHDADTTTTSETLKHQPFSLLNLREHSSLDENHALKRKERVEKWVSEVSFEPGENNLNLSDVVMITTQAGS